MISSKIELPTHYINKCKLAETLYNKLIIISEAEISKYSFYFLKKKYIITVFKKNKYM